MQIEAYTKKIISKSSIETNVTPSQTISRLLLSFSLLLLSPEGKSPSESLDSLLNQTMKLLSAEYAVVLVKKHDVSLKKDCLYCASVSETPNSEGSFSRIDTTKFVISSPDDLFGMSTFRQIIITSDDVANDPRFKKMPYGHPIIKNFISIPLMNHERIVGQLIFSNINILADQNINSPSHRSSIKQKLSSITNQQSHHELPQLSEWSGVIIPLIPIFTQLLDLSQSKNVTSLSQLREKKNTIDVKDQFLANMSHELRTPFNGIVGIIDLFPTIAPLNDKQKEYMSHLSECTGQLLTLLNNLLDYSKMINKRLTLIFESFSIYECIDVAINMISLKAADKKIEIRKSIQQGLGRVVGDKQRLIQVVTNIVGNAIKFTDPGGIVKISVNYHNISHATDITKTWKIVFEISDNGVGIPISEQEMIFSPYYRSSNLSSFHAKNGTGLGLSISNEIVRLMDGKINVKSDGIKGHGSTFSFFIICDETIDVNNFSKKDQEKIRNSRVLIVDDKIENRMMLTDMVLSWEMFPISVSSAEEALRYVKSNIHFDIALVDILMPYMSGIELAQQIRGVNSKIKLVGLSSVDQNDITGQQFFDYFLSKPIERNKLFSAIMNSILKSSLPSQVLYGLPPPIYDGDMRSSDEDNLRNSYDSLDLRFDNGVKKIKKHRKDLMILVAEDDPMNRWTIEQQLLNMGYSSENITIVEDGEKCVEKVEQEPGKYDIILLDIIMPGLNGFETARFVRRLNKNLMIVGVSAAVQITDKSKNLREDIDAFLTKPINRQNLESVLNVFQPDEN